MRISYTFLCVWLIAGCTHAPESTNSEQAFRRIFLGEHEETFSGVYVGDAFMAEHRLDFQKIQLLIGTNSCEHGDIVDVPSNEGLTWLDAMLFCMMIQSNSVARGSLKPGEVVRLPTVQEITEIAQRELTCYWFSNGISNGIPPSAIQADAVYEWTSDIDTVEPLTFFCVRHDPFGRHQDQILSMDALHAYPNLIMRLVIAHEDERTVANRDIASKTANMIWDLKKKQRYHWRPYRELSGNDSNATRNIVAP